MKRRVFLWGGWCVLGAALIAFAATPSPPPVSAQGGGDWWEADLTVVSVWEWNTSMQGNISPAAGFIDEGKLWAVRALGKDASGRVFLTLAGPREERWSKGGEFYTSSPAGSEWVWDMEDDATETGVTHQWEPAPVDNDLSVTGVWKVGLRPSSPPAPVWEPLPTVEAHDCLHLVEGWPMVPSGAPAECAGLDPAPLYVPPTSPWTFYLGTSPSDRSVFLPRADGNLAVARLEETSDAGGAFTEWGGWEVGYGDVVGSLGWPEQSVTVVPHRVCVDMDATADPPDGGERDDCEGMSPDLVCYPGRLSVTEGSYAKMDVDSLDMSDAPAGGGPCRWEGWSHSRSWRAEAVMIWRVFVHSPVFCQDSAPAPSGDLMCGPSSDRTAFRGSDPDDPFAFRNQAVTAAFTDPEVGDVSAGMLYAGEVPQTFACPVQIAAARIDR